MSLDTVFTASLVVGALLALYGNHRFKNKLSSIDSHTANLETLNKRLEAILEDTRPSKDVEAFESIVESSNQAIEKLLDSYKLTLSKGYQGSRVAISFDSSDSHLIRVYYSDYLLSSRVTKQQFTFADKYSVGVRGASKLPDSTTLSAFGTSKSKRDEGYFPSFSGYDCLVA